MDDEGETQSLLHGSQVEPSKRVRCRRPYLVEPVLLLYELTHFSFVAINSEYIYSRVQRDLLPNEANHTLGKTVHTVLYVLIGTKTL